ncbi:MAG: hypothetical protein IT328_16095 [Caldilineaceae bacterium]|nr:hypothetical protein [Caldilineaceae bacterium]
MRVAVLANLKKNAPTWDGMLSDQWDDLDSEKTIQSLIGALNYGGHEATFLEGDMSLYDHLRALKPDICFNICEGHFGDAREAQVPALLEMLRIPYTGSRVMALALALDKPMTKRILTYHGLPTPPFQVFERLDEPLDPALVFPLFVKPSREGTGMGVMADSIVHDEAEMRAKVQKIFDRYRQPALVERFIDGREVTVGLVGNLVLPVARRLPEDGNASRIGDGLHIFPALEVDMARYPAEEGGIYSNRLKVELAEDFHPICPAPLRPDQVEELNWLTAAVFRVIGCLDVARVDFRLDVLDNDRPYILEVNPLPGLSPGISDLCIEAAADGWSYERLINRILDEALRRFCL